MIYDPKLKIAALTLWSRSGRQPFPPHLAKMFWNTGALSTYDLTDDLIRYAVHQTLLSEWEYFLKLAYASSFSESLRTEDGTSNSIQGNDFRTIWDVCTNQDSLEEICSDYSRVFDKTDPVLEHIKAATEIDRQNEELLESRAIGVDRLINIFDHYYRRGDYSVCSLVLEKMSTKPSTWETEECMAHFFHIAGDQDKAERHLNNSINFGSPRSHRCLVTMGLIATRHSHNKSPSRGTYFFEDAYKRLAAGGLSGEDLAYEHAVITNAHALSLYQLKKFDDALLALARAIESLNSTHDQARQQFLALLHDSSAVLEMANRRQGWEHRTHSHFERVLKIYPKYYRYHLNIANFEEICGEHQTSLRHLEVAKELSPSSLYIRERLVDLYEKSDMPTQANGVLRDLMIMNAANRGEYQEKFRINQALLGDIDAYKYLCDKYPEVDQ